MMKLKNIAAISAKSAIVLAFALGFSVSSFADTGFSGGAGCGEYGCQPAPAPAPAPAPSPAPVPTPTPEPTRPSTNVPTVGGLTTPTPPPVVDPSGGLDLTAKSCEATLGEVNAQIKGLEAQNQALLDYIATTDVKLKACGIDQK